MSLSGVPDSRRSRIERRLSGTLLGVDSDHLADLVPEYRADDSARVRGSAGQGLGQMSGLLPCRLRRHWRLVRIDNGFQNRGPGRLEQRVDRVANLGRVVA